MGTPPHIAGQRQSKTVAIYFSEDEIAAIDHFKRKYGKSRNWVVRQCVRAMMCVEEQKEKQNA